MRGCFILLVLWLVVWQAARVEAHALDPGYLELQILTEDVWTVFWKVPQVADGPMPIAALLPVNCDVRSPGELRYDGQGYATDWVATCPGGIQGGEINIEGLERTNTDVLIRYEIIPGNAESYRLTAGSPTFTVPAPQGTIGVLSTYVALGFSHILQGVDHLTFVFVLLLLIRDWRILLGAVTAFTVAHSVSLAASVFGWIVVPAPPVEAVIALSIMFLAAELLRPQGQGLRLSERYPWTVTFLFGLLHGLGFARALMDLGLPEGEVPLALFAFNVGVEIGQILFIGLVFIAAALLARLRPALVASIFTRGQPGSRVLSYLIGGIAAFWFIGRMAVF